jgi:hypothetical protein
MATAVLALAFAAVTDPRTVGYYAAVMVVYVLLQSLADGSAKHVATAAITTPQGLRFLSAYRAWYTAVGCVGLLGAIGAVWLWGCPWRQTLSLLPLVCLPFVIGSNVVALGHMQRNNQWRRISFISSTSTLSSLCVALPLVLVYRSVLGPVCQLVITETLFAVRVRAAARAFNGKPGHVTESESGTNYRGTFWSLSMFLLFVNGQYQMDRILIGSTQGPWMLGLYNTGWGLARNAPDSLLTGALAVLRSQIIDGRAKGRAEVVSLTWSALRRMLLMVSVIVIGLYLGVRIVAPWFLGVQWHEALRAVPLMSISAIPYVCSACLIPGLMLYNRMRLAAGLRSVGILLSCAVAWAATQSLMAAAWAAVIRELLLMAIMLPVARGLASARMVLLTLTHTSVLLAATLVADMLLFP